jgi:uncharacterized membrane protein
MDLAFNILLMLHLAALIVAGGTNIAMPLIGRQMAGAPQEVLARLGPIAGRLSVNGRVSLAVLVLTGVAMLWLRYDGNAAGLGRWFTAKMALVIALVVLSVLGLFTRRVPVSPRVFGMINRVTLIAVVVCAVMAFG